MDKKQTEFDFAYDDEFYEHLLREEENRRNSQPKYLFKYKAFRTSADIDRFFDVVKNNRIYMPNYKQLNDPLEGTNAKMIGIDPKVRNKEREKWQILALSEDCLLPTLWAYYAENYTGVCIGFKTRPAFESVIKVEYVYDQKSLKWDVPLFMDEDLKRKNRCWFYEKEWRIIRSTEFNENGTIANQFYSFVPEALAHIFIGYEMPDNLKKIIAETVPSTTQLWIVEPDCKSYGLVAKNIRNGQEICKIEELT